MSAEQAPPTMWVRELTRSPQRGPEDSLLFEPGVNVLYGVPNTGKSKWLRMLDYLFADDSKAVEAFGDDLAGKYDSLHGVLRVGSVDWKLERRWKEPGQLTKILVNDTPMSLHDFSLSLLDALQIPVLHYPQGNPYGSRAWPELGWRSLFRHMYRRQEYWADFADRQPESEQHACMLQFVGIAEAVYSEQYGNLVTMEKKLQDMKNRREQFVEMLQEISRELVDEDALGVALTPESIAAAIAKHENDERATQEERERLLLELLGKTNVGASPTSRGVVESLTAKLAELRKRYEAATITHQKAVVRLAELENHRATVDEESARMQRAIDAGSVLADLKITHCPACDQPIRETMQAQDSCYLCSQPIDATAEGGVALRRLKFEVSQLSAEVQETDELIGVVRGEIHTLDRQRVEIREEIDRVELGLRPTRSAAASVLPPEIAVLDQQTGRIQERVAQLRRIDATLKKREAIAEEILHIQAEVTRLESVLHEESKNISFERAGDALTDGMNTFLNVINEVKPDSWTQDPVEFVLRDRSFHVRIGKAGWRAKLGGTLKLFFLLAYHYALIGLAGKRGRHFPGMCVLDFPPQLDGVTVSDSEDFVLTPFVRMMGEQVNGSRQLIAAGSSFAGVEGAHRIELKTVWK